MALTTINSGGIKDDSITTDDISSTDVKSLRSGRKNLIINGGFDVWQRGTSFNYSSSGANTYHADRWRFEGYNFTGSVTKTTLDNANALEFAVTNSSAGYVNVMQRVELTDSTLLGKTITLSAKIKGNGNFNIRVQAGAANTVTAITTATQTVTATSTISSSDISNGFTNVRFQFDTNDTGTITIANVQLELGDTATDFEYRSYGEELALCQRYFYSTPFASNTYSTTTSNLEISGARHKFADVAGYRSAISYFPVTMRATPSMTFYNGETGTAGQVRLYDHTGSTQNFSAFTRTYAYGTKFNGYTGVTVGTYGYSVECWVSYIADAEL